MHSAGGLKNPKVCVAEIDTLLTKIDCEKTKDISKYHSFEFGTSSMKMTRYYGIGDGIEQNYGHCNFQSGLTVKQPFHKTSNGNEINPTKNGKCREDRKLCELFFCQESGCKAVFEKKEHYDAHLLEGNQAEQWAMLNIPLFRK